MAEEAQQGEEQEEKKEKPPIPERVPPIDIPARRKTDIAASPPSNMSPRFSLIEKLPPPPKPPQELEICVEKVSQDEESKREIKKRESVSILVDPRDGKPYRLKPLNTPDIKPTPPKKNSIVG